MSYRYEKETGDLIISGFDQGIAVSPHKGISNLQSVNIATESNEVMNSFGRVQQSVTPFTGVTINANNSTTVVVLGAPILFVVGSVIRITASTITNLTSGNSYYVFSASGVLGNQNISFTETYNGTQKGSLGVTGTATGASFNLNIPIAKAKENYFDGTAQSYRYYIIDNKGQVWVQDTSASSWSQANWTPVELNTNLPTGAFSWGIGVYQGYLHIFSLNSIYVKETSLLGITWKQTNLVLNSQNLTQGHYVLTGHQSAMNYTDSNFVGQIQGDSTTTGNFINTWSYATYTVSASVVTISNLIGGNFPLVGQKITFSSSGTIDSNLTADTVYYVISSNYSSTAGTFKISATVGGSAFSFAGNGTGTQYFNAYNPGMTGGPVATDGNGASTLLFTPQACTLPTNEQAQCLGEAGNFIIIGCKGNVLYPWDQTSPTASGIINLPESNAVSMLSVNNMVYVFAGNKGNVYITNASTASAVVTIPDYTAGVPGSPSTYLEPYFVWGGNDYIRGRVYFSVLDQTATKTGNCGGIWSFVPTQNFYVGQDIGLALRMENQNSYGTYSGYAPVIMANENQAAVGVQYFTAWVSAYNYPSSGTAGFDASGTFPIATAVVETDLIPTGTLLTKKTFSNIEYKTASPLLSGESITLNYRLNLTDAWLTCGVAKTETSQTLSGVFTANFQLSQELQLQANLIPNGTSTFSGNRLVELRIRP